MDQLIKKCNFNLNCVHITIVLNNEKKLVKELRENMHVGRKIKQKDLPYPIKPNIFLYNRRIEYRKNTKIFLTYGKYTRKGNIDAILTVRDALLNELKEIQEILKKLPSIENFKFNCVALSWDFYTNPNHTAQELQLWLAKHLHITNATKAFRKPTENTEKHESIDTKYTFFIEDSKSGLQSQLDIRKKIYGRSAVEYVRLELKENKKWFYNTSRIRPSGFYYIIDGYITVYVQWLDIDWPRIKKYAPNMLSPVQTTKKIKQDLNRYGIAKVIIKYGKRLCSQRRSRKCKNEMCAPIIPSKKGISRNEPSTVKIKCSVTRQYAEFKLNFCKNNKHESHMNWIMTYAFIRWDPSAYDKIYNRKKPKRKKGRPKKKKIPSIYAPYIIKDGKFIVGE